MLHFSWGKKIAILSVLLWGLYFALPNAMPTQWGEKLGGLIADKTINLGLDLQGGAHLVLEVGLEDVHKRAYETMEETVRVLGGKGSVRGVILGGLILILLPEYLRAFQQYRMLMFGFLLIVMMVFRPGGIIQNVRKIYKIEGDLENE